MRSHHYVTFLGLATAMTAVACSSQNTDHASGVTAGTRSDTTTAPVGSNVGGTASNATGAGIDVHGGAGNTTNTSPVSPTGQVAEDTEDGLATVSTEQATKLTDAATTCSGWASEPEETAQPPVLEFAIDVTGSMADMPADPNDASGASKWDAMQSVLPSAFQGLPTNWIAGVSYFRKPDNGCFEPDQSVPIDVMSTTQLAAIEDSIARRGPKGNTTDADNVQGATPTYAAWKHALERLSTYVAPTGYESSKRYIVLITDGVPTVNADGCTYVNPITQEEYDSEIALVKSEGDALSIKTFVVGVRGSELAQNATYDPLFMLSNLAVAGGTEKPVGCVPVTGTLDAERTTLAERGSYCHYDLSQSTDFAGDLVSALSNIQRSLVSCRYTLPPPPTGKTIDPNETVIVYQDGSGKDSVVLPNTSATCDRGWHFTDATHTELEICGKTCDLIQADPKARLNVIFGCTVAEIIGPLQ